MIRDALDVNCDVKLTIITVKDTHRINSSLSNCRHAFLKDILILDLQNINMLVK